MISRQTLLPAIKHENFREHDSICLSGVLSAEERVRIVRYILNNPVKAGLGNTLEGLEMELSARVLERNL